jgi:hypothetical protein
MKRLKQVPFCASIRADRLDWLRSYCLTEDVSVSSIIDGLVSQLIRREEKRALNAKDSEIAADF